MVGAGHPDESRPGPGLQQTGRGGGGPFGKWGIHSSGCLPSARCSTARRWVQHGLAMTKSSEVSEVTMRSEEDEAAAIASSRLGSTRACVCERGIRRRPLHALATKQEHTASTHIHTQTQTENKHKQKQTHTQIANCVQLHTHRDKQEKKSALRQVHVCWVTPLEPGSTGPQAIRSGFPSQGLETAS